MSVEANKQTVKQFFDYMGRGDADGAFSLLTPDAIWWIPSDQPGGTTIPRHVMEGSVGAFFSVFEKPPVMESGRMTAEGDRVCLEQTARGGITKGGASYGNDYHMLFQFRDGLICEVREYMNPLLSAPVAAEIQAMLEQRK